MNNDVNNQVQNTNVNVQPQQANNPQPQTINNAQIQQELEELRLKAVKKQNIIYIIGAIVFITVAIIFIKAEVYQMLIVAFFFILVVTILVAALVPEVKQFTDAYKSKIVITTLNSIFSDVHFDLNRGIPEKVIADTNMMMMGNIYNSNDYFYGKYKDIQFQCSDVTIQDEYTDSDGDTHTTTYFIGQWYIFEFNKTFKGSFQICEKSFHYSKRQGGLFSKTQDEKIEMEDQEFNKIFKVFGTDPHSVFYVLTPNTMERIKKINSQIPGELLFCFKDNNLHVGVYNNKDLFEPRLRKPVNIEKDTQSTRDEINAILQFVDTLKLDNDLFK